MPSLATEAMEVSSLIQVYVPVPPETRSFTSPAETDRVKSVLLRVSPPGRAAAEA